MEKKTKNRGRKDGERLKAEPKNHLAGPDLLL